MILYSHYAVFVAAFLGLSGLGFLAGARTLLTAVVLGVSFIGMVGGILAVFQPSLCKWFFLLAMAASLIALAWKLMKDGKQTLSSIRPRWSDAVILVAVVVLFRHLDAHAYIFEAHDVLYFTPALEMLRADYGDSLRMFTYWPATLAAFHHFPSAILAAPMSLLQAPTIIDAVIGRFSLIVIVFFLFFRWTVDSPKGWQVAIAGFALLMIFGEELSYQLSVSSFVYVAILVSLARAIVSESERLDVIILHFIVLVCAKAPIAHAALACAVLGTMMFWRDISRLKIAAAFAVMAVVIVSWVTPPPPYAGEDLGTRLYLGLNGALAEYSMQGVYRWTMQDNLTREIVAFADRAPLAVTLAVFIVMLIKVYLPATLLSYRLSTQGRDGPSNYSALTKRRLGFLVFAFFAMTLFGLLWIRNGLSISHQAHGPILAACFLGFIACAWFRYHAPARLWFLLIPLMLFYLPREVTVEVPHEHIERGRSGSADRGNYIWRYGDRLPSAENADTYKPQDGETMLKSELNAALTGRRLLSDDAPGAPSGQIQYWWVR